MWTKEVTFTAVADTKSPKWKRLCVPESSGLGPMGIKTAEVPKGEITLYGVIMDQESYDAYRAAVAAS